MSHSSSDGDKLQVSNSEVHNRKAQNCWDVTECTQPVITRMKWCDSTGITRLRIAKLPAVGATIASHSSVKDLCIFFSLTACKKLDPGVRSKTEMPVVAELL